MTTGKIVWLFEPLKFYPYLEKGYMDDDESQRMDHSFSVAHVFSDGVVFEMNDPF